jgi:hypothetical protein
VGSPFLKIPCGSVGLVFYSTNFHARAVFPQVFHNVAKKYDIMNDVMSAGVHRVWKEQFVSVLNPQPGMKLLDVAGGTGAIANQDVFLIGGIVFSCIYTFS